MLAELVELEDVAAEGALRHPELAFHQVGLHHSVQHCLCTERAFPFEVITELTVLFHSDPQADCVALKVRTPYQSERASGEVLTVTSVAYFYDAVAVGTLDDQHLQRVRDEAGELPRVEGHLVGQASSLAVAKLLRVRAAAGTSVRQRSFDSLKGAVQAEQLLAALAHDLE